MRGETLLIDVSGSMDWISIHSPHAGRDLLFSSSSSLIFDFNPLSPCGERREMPDKVEMYANISIHSPHAGRDADLLSASQDIRHFNPLSPCGERPVVQSPSMSNGYYFNPLSPCGERLKLEFLIHTSKEISIHSPHAGRDKIFTIEIL